MTIRRYCLGVVALVAAAAPLPAAQVRTQNFVVTAPDQRIAEQFGQMAEHYRKQKAIEWLGREMEAWPQPCPLHVKPTMSGAGGATTFDYRNGGYVVLSMNIEGSLERMLNSVLPHEVTHTVFAHHFRCPVPRWADEGGSVLSEDDQERARHDQLCRNYLNSPQRIPLRQLFNVHDYEQVKDRIMALYAEGYSMSNFLVGTSDRQTFLNFVAAGMRQGWDRAAQTYYGYQSVEQMEEGWLQSLRSIARNPAGRPSGTAVAANPNGGRPAGTTVNREVVRLTAPPAQPELDAAGPVYRGQAADDGRTSRAAPPHGVIPLGSAPRPQSNSQSSRPTPPPPVTLGLPEFAPNAQSGPIAANGPSPVGGQR